MASWLLQCNESQWHLRDFFTEGHTATDWPIRQHWKRMAAGDEVALWLSGPGGGVVAVGRVTGVPRRGVPDAEFRTASSAAQWLAPVEFGTQFVDHPIGREKLAADPRFAHALILRMSGGRSPLPLTPDEWAAVVDHVPPGGLQLVATAVRGAAVVVAVGATAVREAFRSAIPSA